MKCKKVLLFLFFILITLSMAANVHADEELNLNLKYTLSGSYVIEIPSEIEFNKGSASADITISNIEMSDDQSMYVSINSDTAADGAFLLTHNKKAEYTIPYFILIQDSDGEMFQIHNSRRIMTFSNYDLTDNFITKHLFFSSQVKAPIAGEYSGLLTFSVGFDDNKYLGLTSDLAGIVVVEEDAFDYTTGEISKMVYMCGGLELDAPHPSLNLKVSNNSEWGFEITFNGQKQLIARQERAVYAQIILGRYNFLPSDRHIFGQKSTILIMAQAVIPQEMFENMEVREFVDFDGDLTTTEDTLYYPVYIER